MASRRLLRRQPRGYATIAPWLPHVMPVATDELAVRSRSPGSVQENRSILHFMYGLLAYADDPVIGPKPSAGFNQHPKPQALSPGSGVRPRRKPKLLRLTKAQGLELKA